MNGIALTPATAVVAFTVGVGFVLLFVWLPYALCLLADRKRKS